MHSLYQVLLFIHALSGLTGLLVFWLPLIARKGSVSHKRMGRIFTTAMQFAGGTAVVMTLLLYVFPLQVRGASGLDAASQQEIIARAYGLAQLLLPLGLLLLANTRQAVLVLRCKQDRAPLRQPAHQLLIFCLALASAQLLYHAISGGGVLHWVFSLLGIGSALNMWRYTFKAEIRRGEWLGAHIGNILGAGIGAHTAFLVFGARSFLEQWVATDLQLWLWIAPSVIGGLAIILVSRRYARA